MNGITDNIFSNICVYDKVCKEAGLAQQWCGINKVCVFASRGASDHDQPSQWAPYESKVYEFRDEPILYDEEMRKLVHETCGSFISSRHPPKDIDVRAWVLSISHEHRSTIRQCIENLQIAAIKSKDEKMNDWAEMFSDIEVLWHLCELLHLDIVQADIVLPRLLEWLQFQSGDLEMKASEMYSDSDTTGADQRCIDYWDVVIRLLLQGRFEASRALLRLHSQSETAAFLEADVLLRSIPVYTVFSGLTVSEFNSRWRSWKAAVRAKIRAATFESHPKLLTIMNILGAERMPIKELKPYCDKWYTLMISALTFIDPTVKIHELTHHAKLFISEYGGKASLTQYDETILSIFDSDLHGVINKLRTLQDGGWSAVHLGNLLYLSGFGKIPNSNGIVLVTIDSLFLDYGQLLMSHDSMWQVGVRYVAQCSYGKDALASLLERIPLGTEKKAIRVAGTAKEFGLNEVAESIYRVMTLKCLKNKETGNVLTWLLMSNDSEFVSQIADHYLRRYAMERQLDCKETLAHLGQCSLPSARLTFLAKYCEFQELYDEGECREAAKLLIRLIDSKVAPKFFWITLLFDALPLLLSPANTAPLFSQDDTIVISACLEELCTDLSETFVRKRSDFDEKCQVLRKAIAENLAKTLILESCGPTSERIIKCK